MGYKLIALDIDGTIRGAEHDVSDRTRTAVARVQESGAAVTLATGRMFPLGVGVHRRAEHQRPHHIISRGAYRRLKDR